MTQAKHHVPKKMRPLSLSHFYILTALDGRHLNRTEIRRRAVENSRGDCGSLTNLASILPRLTRKGWIELDSWQRRPENRPGTFYYHLLPAGRAALAEEVRRLEAAVEKLNQKLSLARHQLNLPIPPPFERTILKVESTLPSRRAIKNRVPLSVIKDSRKRKLVEALRQRRAISVQEAAVCLGVTKGTIYNWCQKGILESTRVEGKYGVKTYITTASMVGAIEREQSE